MRLVTTLGTAVLAAAPVLGGALPAGAASATTLDYIAVEQSQKNLPPNGFLLTDNDFTGGRKIGVDTVDCTFSEKAAVGYCAYTAALSGGEVHATFTITSGNSTVYTGRVQGGTGRYRGATGSFWVNTFGGNANNAHIVMVVRTP